MSVEIKFSGHEKLNAALKKALSRVPGAKQKFLAQEAEILIGNVKFLTPVDTGRLRNSWARTQPSGDSVEVYNNTSYAPYVEFGHRQFVFGRDTGRITPGRFMLRDAVDKTAENFPADSQAVLRNIFGG